MLIQIEEKQTVTKSIELKLPAFYRSGNTYYHITEEVELIEVSVYKDYGCTVCYSTKQDPTHSITILQALSSTESNPTEFWFQFEKALAIIQEKSKLPTL